MDELENKLRMREFDKRLSHCLDKEAADKIERLNHAIDDCHDRIGELETEVLCEEGRFNDLSDMYAGLSKKNDKMREVLTEIQQCSEYWSEYAVPLGIHNMIKEALQDDD